MNLVKQQINGDERIVLKSRASIADLQAEALRLQHEFGYRIEPRPGGKYTLTHPFFHGEFVLSLEPEG